MAAFFTILGILHVVAPLLALLGDAIHRTRPVSRRVLFLSYLGYFYRGLALNLALLGSLPLIALLLVIGPGALLGCVVGLGGVVIVGIEQGLGYDIPGVGAHLTARDGLFAAILLAVALAMLWLLGWAQEKRLFDRWIDLLAALFRPPLVYLERSMAEEVDGSRD